MKLENRPHKNAAIEIKFLHLKWMTKRIQYSHVFELEIANTRFTAVSHGGRSQRVSSLVCRIYMCDSVVSTSLLPPPPPYAIGCIYANTIPFGSIHFDCLHNTSSARTHTHTFTLTTHCHAVLCMCACVSVHLPRSAVLCVVCACGRSHIAYSCAIYHRSTSFGNHVFSFRLPSGPGRESFTFRFAFALMPSTTHCIRTHYAIIFVRRFDDRHGQNKRKTTPGHRQRITFCSVPPQMSHVMARPKRSKDKNQFSNKSFVWFRAKNTFVRVNKTKSQKEHRKKNEKFAHQKCI